MHTHTLSASAHGFGVTANVRAFWRRLRTAVLVMRERRALAGLSDTALADLGLRPEDAAREAARPIWDLPANR